MAARLSAEYVRDEAGGQALTEQCMTEASIEVTVCICTFRRAALRIAIESVVRQILPPEGLLRILVIDNDIEPTARHIVEGFRGELGIDVRYRHAPAQNISIARNAGLDEAETPWLAFIDDDERASSDWLEKLLAARSDAQAVFGPCEALYPEDAASWMKRADFHSNRINERNNPIDTGYTSNVLIDMNFVRQHGIRFDLALGGTGGEDTIFFHKMYRLGGVLKYAPRAVVYEDVVASRTNIGWIATRRYRAGQTYAMMLRKFSPRDYWRSAWASPLKISTCAIMSMSTAYNSGRAAWWIMRGIFHFGVLSYALGLSIRQEYKIPSNSAS
jgi:succinoglycan biosynthesis protein ExoM